MSQTRIPQVGDSKKVSGNPSTDQSPRSKPRSSSTGDDLMNGQMVGATIEGLNGGDRSSAQQLSGFTISASSSRSKMSPAKSNAVSDGTPVAPVVAGGSVERAPLSLSPETVLRQYGTKLTAFEHKEILAYPDIYFIGLNAKKQSGITAGGINNGGYDDEQGCYINVCHDHMAYRYELLKVQYATMLRVVHSSEYHEYYTPT